MEKGISINKEFIAKMAEAKRLEKEAILCLFPTGVKDHVRIIEKELAEIVKETIDFIIKSTEEQEKAEHTKKVKKIKIEGEQ